jgi:hypothetical protein
MDRHRCIHRGDLIRLLLFFQNKEKWTKNGREIGQKGRTKKEGKKLFSE